MALRRLVGVFMLAVLTSAGLVGNAVADTYGPKPGTITVSSTVVTQGGSVKVRADGFCPETAAKLTVTVSGSRYRSSFLTGSNGRGIIYATVKLTETGSNKIQLSGCRAGGGGLVLAARVRVVPHEARNGKVDDHDVRKGDKVSISSEGYCRRSKVLVRVLDDGREYKRIQVRSDTAGKAAVRVRLTRVGTTTLVMSGCRATGGKQAYSERVTVRKAKNFSFSASPTAFVDQVTSGPGAAAYGVLAGGLVLLFAGGQLLVGRRRRTATVRSRSREAAARLSR
jgi:hypothetical protein